MNARTGLSRSLPPALAALLLLCTAGAARAEARIVVAAGANTGVAGDVPLRYAEGDAERVLAAFAELGGVSHRHLLTGASASRLQAALAAAGEEVKEARRRGERTLLVFYFSGHADQDFLRAGGTRLTWDKVRSLVRGVGADTTVSFIDACGSGGAIPKGATPGAPFSVAREGGQSSGAVWFTSSRGGEASYESDELGGSFFTHYLVSALRGAADRDEDGLVTLGEVYRFTYEQTVGETSLRLRSVQHPRFEFELSGEGDVILAEAQLARASLVLPRELDGTYFVSRRFGAQRNVIEVAKRPGELVRLSVGEGTHLVYRRDEDRIWIASYAVPPGQEVVVSGSDLLPRRYQEVVGKGGAIRLATWRTYAEGGASWPVVRGQRDPFAIGRAGVTRRDGWLGVGAELGYGQFAFQAVDTRIQNRSFELSLRVEAFREGRLGLLSAGAGLGGLLLEQSPRGAASVHSFSPGLLVYAALERKLIGRASLRADASFAVWFLRPERQDGWSARLSPRVGLGLSLDLR